MRTGFRRSSLILILLGIATLTTLSPAQELSNSAEFDTWTDIATIYKFNDRWRYDGDYGLRSWLTSRGFRQFYARPSFRYGAKRWLLLHGGIAYFRTTFDEGDPINEIRPWVGLRFVGPRPGRFVFSNYFRVEWRSFDRGSRPREGVGRARYQLQLTTPRFKIGRSEGFYALTFAEAFKNFGPSVDDLIVSQFRFDVGLGKQVSRGLRIELNYLFQKAAVEGTGLEPNDHILRIRLFYVFK